jgi:hypothetical protein
MKPMSQQAAGLVHGFRSGLEHVVAKQLEAEGIAVCYEQLALKYITPEKLHRYTPDFELPNGIIIETKGRFMVKDRQKHLLVQQQHPELDIRFVFTNSRAKISKASSTTYAMWCNKFNFKYADKLIPLAWIEEER